MSLIQMFDEIFLSNDINNLQFYRTFSQNRVEQLIDIIKTCFSMYYILCLINQIGTNKLEPNQQQNQLHYIQQSIHSQVDQNLLQFCTLLQRKSELTSESQQIDIQSHKKEMNKQPLEKRSTQSHKKNEQQTLKSRLFQQLNQFRKNPQYLLPYLKERKLHYTLQPPNLNLFSPNHPKKGLVTQQGPAPINQLIGLLYSMDPLPLLLQNQILTLSAQHIAQSLKHHQSLNQIKLSQTTAKYLRNQLNQCLKYDFTDKITCLIGICFDRDQNQPLIGLLMDDGDKMRKNRLLMMKNSWRFVGTGTTLIERNEQYRIVVYLFTNNILKKK